MNYRWKNYAFQLNVNNVTNEWYLQRSVSKDQILQGPERLIKVRAVARSDQRNRRRAGRPGCRRVVAEL